MFQHYRGKGLSQQVVGAFLQDQKGYVWIGTRAGLNRFDGEDFVSFGVKDGMAADNIYSLYEYPDGRLVVGTTRGISIFDGLQFTNYDQQGQAQVVRAIAPVGDGLWLGTSPGLLYFDGEEITRPDIAGNEGSVLALLPTADRLWVCRDNGLYYLDEGNALVPHPVPALGGKRVLNAVEGEGGSIWVSVEDGFYQLDNQRILTYYASNNTTGQPIGGLLRDRFGELWMGTNRGLMHLRNGELNFLSIDQGQPLTLVLTIMEDRDGMLWFGGLPAFATFNGRAFTNYTEEDGIFSARILTRDRKDRLWVGTLSGLTVFDGPRRTDFGMEDGLNNDFILSVFERSNGDILIGHNAGLNRSDGASIFEVPQVPENIAITSMAETQDRVLYIYGSEFGLGILRGDDLIPVTIPDQTLSGTKLLVDSKNRLWAGGEMGLSRLEDGVWTTYGLQDGLADVRPYEIIEDRRGRIWFGYHTSRGVSIWNNGRITTYDTSNGLSADAVYTLGEDAEGNIWIGHTTGIDRYDGEAFMHFNMSDGLSDNETNTDAFVAYEDGRVAIGTMSGFSIFEPRYDLARDVQPHIWLEQPRLGGEAFKDGAYIQHDRNHLETRIAFLNFARREHMDVSWRILGLNDQWRPLIDPEINQPGLPPNRYALEVRASVDGNAVALTRLAFIIEPPWWSTWWFRALCVLAVGLVIAMIYWRRVNTYQRQKKKLEKMVDRRTAELNEEVAQRKKAQEDLLAAQDELLEQAHQAGRADIATGVLHNIGNLLSSVITSAGMLRETLESNNLERLTAVAELVREHQNDLQAFIDKDPKAKQLMVYIERLEPKLRQEQQDGQANLVRLLDKVDVIRAYIMMHQTYAKSGFFEEEVTPAQLIEDALALQANSIDRHSIELIKEIQPVPRIRVQKAKLINILINLYKNAKEAMNAQPEDERRLTIRLYGEGTWICIEVEDSGHGIAEEDMAKLFTQGFTTKHQGHGFGLHSCANYMTEMGGDITARSDGPGKGAVFTIKFPLIRENNADKIEEATDTPS